jgi:AraC-like DNA-binding protein
MKISPAEILFILVIFQLLFLSLFLLTRERGTRISNILLGFFFLSISINLFDFFLFQEGYYDSTPRLAGWGSCIPLLFGPLIYFYTRSVVYKNFHFSLRNCLHFFPFIILCAGTEYFYLNKSRNDQENIISRLHAHHFPALVSAVSLLIFIQFLSYVIISLNLVSKYKKASGQFFSNSKNSDVSWLYTTLISLILIIVVTIINGVIAQTPWAKYYLTVFNIVIFLMLLYVVRVMLKALSKPDFFSISEEESFHHQSPGSRLKGSLRPVNNETGRIAQTVLEYVKNNKPYLDPELNLDQLARQLSLKSRLLSQVINDELGQNFHDFINRKRIEEASRLLTNPKDPKITVLEVLYEVGFNSKSSFNTLFKKYTGLTPSEFKKKNHS